MNLKKIAMVDRFMSKLGFGKWKPGEGIVVPNSGIFVTGKAEAFAVDKFTGKREKIAETGNLIVNNGLECLSHAFLMGGETSTDEAVARSSGGTDTDPWYGILGALIGETNIMVEPGTVECTWQDTPSANSYDCRDKDGDGIIYDDPDGTSPTNVGTVSYTTGDVSLTAPGADTVDDSTVLFTYSYRDKDAYEMQFGNDGTAPTASDSDLGTPYADSIYTISSFSYPSSTQVQYVVVSPDTDPTTGTWTIWEAGVFSRDHTLISRGVFGSSITKGGANVFELEVKWTYTFSRAS